MKKMIFLYILSLFVIQSNCKLIIYVLIVYDYLKNTIKQDAIQAKWLSTISVIFFLIKIEAHSYPRKAFSQSNQYNC